MKKIYSVFIASVILVMSTSAFPARSIVGDLKDVPIRKEGTPEESDRPHAPALSLFTVFLDTDLGSLFVSSRYDVGEVSATIENLLTGDFFSYTFDSTDSALLPINGSAGFWTITLTLDNGTEFAGEFQL